MIELDSLIRDGARYLEAHRRCPKHHVEHTGSNCYLLDFYTALGEVEQGKELVSYLLSLIVADGTSKIFYPGRLNPMNMSNSVIDSGSAVDAIARFVRRNAASYSADERAAVIEGLRPVVEQYLATAAADKPITNQRLWGLTGLASFAGLAGEEERYRPMIIESIERAFRDTTPDGFFRYYPGGTPTSYDGITTFYQSRHSAFIRYTLEQVGIDPAPYAARLAHADRALLAMYTARGWKDLRLECKRWYWQSAYEVASHGFDAYALARSSEPESERALHNVLYQVRAHFADGYLHSHHGSDINFQCPIFWTAHLAWMLRVEDIQRRFAEAEDLVEFRYSFRGKEVFTDTRPGLRTLVNAHWSARNPSTGIYESGLEGHTVWRVELPALPEGLGFSLHETLNHIWYALRGLHIYEAGLRLLRMLRELVVMVLPRYSARYGKITALTYAETGNELTVSGMVAPASKYGTLGGAPQPFSLRLPL